MSSLALLEGIFPTQGSNLGLLHCRQILYHPSHQKNALMMEVYNKKKFGDTVQTTALKNGGNGYLMLTGAAPSLTDPVSFQIIAKGVARSLRAPS